MNKQAWRDSDLNNEVIWAIKLWFRSNAEEKYGILSDRQILDLSQEVYNIMCEHDLIET